MAIHSPPVMIFPAAETLPPPVAYTASRCRRSTDGDALEGHLEDLMQHNTTRSGGVN